MDRSARWWPTWRRSRGGRGRGSSRVPARMTATIIDGKEVAARVRAEVARDVAEMRERTGRVPGLATILVGEDPASEVYVRGKRKASAEVGITDHHQHLPGDSTQADVAAVIEAC